MRSLAVTDDAVYPVGGRTCLDFGAPPARPGALVDTTALNRVVDYPSEELTITVGAGIRVAELARILAEKRQMLPLDVPFSEQATLGGLLATNSSGPRRFAYGTARDHVLGLDVVDASGERIHGGGRVVKNVAGYDMPKMHIGALGTLGIIVEVSLKLRPTPEARVAVACCLNAAGAVQAMEICTRSTLRPTAVELLNRRAAAALPALASRLDQPLLFVVLFEEATEAVAAQMQDAASRLRVFGEVIVLADEYEEALTQLAGWSATAPGPIAFKANLRRTDVAGFFELAERLFPDIGLHAHAGSGVVWGVLPIAELSQVAEPLDALRRWATAKDGGLILLRCPTDWKSRLGVWGAPRGDYFLMRRLRERLDPKRRINPGRFVVE